MHRFEFDASDLEQVAAWLGSQPDYAPFTFRDLGSQTLHETYLDTEDWSLYRARFSLSIQGTSVEAEVKLRQLGSEKNGLREEREWTQPLPEYSLGAGEDSVAQRVKLLTDDKPLQTLFVTEVQRQTHEVRSSAGALGVINLDVVSLTKHGECLRTLSHVSVVAAQSEARKALEPFVEGIGEACGLIPARSSLFAVGLEAAGLEPRAHFDFGYVGLLPDSATGEYAYALMRRYFGDFLISEPGTRLGEDPEALHDMRVATRKSRAAISIFKDALSPRFVALREELKWLGQALGEVRDLDVQSIWLTGERDSSGWQQSVALGPLIEELATSRAAARARLLADMHSPRYAELIDGMKKALIQADYATESSAEPVRRCAARILRKRFSQFEAIASELQPDSASTAYHAARISGKRLRYALESFYPILEDNPRAVRVVNSAKRVQDLLGEYQDCVTAIARLEAMAQTAALPTATVFLMGQLVERLRKRMEDIREAWPSSYENLHRNWQRVSRLLKNKLDLQQAPDDADEVDADAPPVAVQRPFWLLRRFVGHSRIRPDETDSGRHGAGQ